MRAETRRLLELGRDGGYIFAPAHAVEGDVPLENMLAFIEVIQSQPGYRASADRLQESHREPTPLITRIARLDF